VRFQAEIKRLQQALESSETSCKNYQDQLTELERLNREISSVLHGLGLRINVG
jgi:hypothetical protein